MEHTLNIFINFNAINNNKIPTFMEFAKAHAQTDISTLLITPKMDNPPCRPFKANKSFQAFDLLQASSLIRGPAEHQNNPNNKHATALRNYLENTKNLDKCGYQHILIMGEFSADNQTISCINDLALLSKFIKTILTSVMAANAKIRFQICQANSKNSLFFAKNCRPNSLRPQMSAPLFQSVVSPIGNAIDFLTVPLYYTSARLFLYYCLTDLKVNSITSLMLIFQTFKDSPVFFKDIMAKYHSEKNLKNLDENMSAQNVIDSIQSINYYSPTL